MTGRQLRNARRAAERLERKSASSSRASSPAPGKAETEGIYGLYSRLPIIEWEERAEFNELRATLYAEHRPATPTEEILVNEITQHIWRMRRFRYMETATLGASYFEPARVTAVQRALAATERGFHKTLATLRQLQEERGFVSQNPSEAVPAPAPENTSTAEIGFVPQNAPFTDDRFGFVSQNPVPKDPFGKDSFGPSDSPQNHSKAA